MSTENQRERLKWKYKPFPELVRLAWPIAVSMLSYSVMTLVDTLFVGRLGASALAGVGLGGVASFSLVCFGLGLLRAVKTLVSQAVGAGNRAGAPLYVSAGLAIAAVLGVATIATGWLVSPFLPDMAATFDSGRLARDYFDVRLLGAPLVLVGVALREGRYGFGDSRSAMVATLVAAGVNIALDYLFIFVLGHGVVGAAWASVAAHAVEVAVLVLVYRRAGARFPRPSWRHVRSVWRIGVPTAVQFVLEVGSFAVLVVMIAGMSEIDLAAHQIALQVVHFSFLPAFAIGEAGSVLAGQAVGANEDGLVKRVARQTMLAAGVYTGLCTVLFAGGAHTIAAAFTPDAGLRLAAAHLLYVAAVFQVFDAAAIVSRCTLRGAGDVRYPAVVGVVVAWVTTPPLAWLFGYRLGLGALGGWVALAIEIFAGAAILWWRLERGGWMTAARRSRDELAEDAAVEAHSVAIAAE